MKNKVESFFVIKLNSNNSGRQSYLATRITKRFGRSQYNHTYSIEDAYIFESYLSAIGMIQSIVGNFISGSNIISNFSIEQIAYAPVKNTSVADIVESKDSYDIELSKYLYETTKDIDITSTNLPYWIDSKTIELIKKLRTIYSEVKVPVT